MRPDSSFISVWYIDSTQSTTTHPSIFEIFSQFARSKEGVFLESTDRRGDKNYKFVCKRLHSFELSPVDMHNNKWCSKCENLSEKDNTTCFTFLQPDDTNTIKLKCKKNHIININTNRLTLLKECSVCKKEESETENTDEHTNGFLNVYTRIIETCSIIKKIPLKNLVRIYFENEIQTLPENNQSNSMATHIILEYKAFVRSIFDRLSKNMKKRFFYKLNTILMGSKSDINDTKEAVDFLKSLVGSF